MSYAHPSPPTSQTLLRTSASAIAIRSRASLVSRPAISRLTSATRWRCDAIPASVDWSASRISATRRFAHVTRQPPQQFPRVVSSLVEREPHPQPEFRVVFEQRIRPRRPAAFGIRGVRRGRQIAAVYRGASGCVRNQQSIAEELGEQLDVGRLAASCARSGKFEQRFEQLRIFNLRMREAVAIELRQRQEEVPVLRLGVAKRRLRQHVDRLVPHLALALRRANLHAQAASGAILGRYLQRVTHRLEAAPSRRRRLERRGRIAEETRLVNFRANHRMRADQHAFPALDAQLLIPDRESPARCCASPISPCRSEKCRRAAARWSEPNRRGPR